MDPSIENIKDLKKQIKKNLELTSKNKYDQDLWDSFIENSISKSKFTIPEIMLEQETENLIKQQKEMIENQKIEFDTYLEGIKKSEEEFESELASSANLRLKRAIIVEEIITHYEVEIDDNIINDELKKFKELQRNTNYSDDSIKEEIKYQKKRDEIIKIIKLNNINKS
jgi:trigger factor